MTGSESIPPRRTTLWGGGAILVSSVLGLLAFIPPVGSAGVALFRFSGHVPTFIASVLVLAGACILAFGIGGESGIVGRSVAGKIGLVLFGVGDLAIWLSVELTSGLSLGQLRAVGYVDLAIAIVVLAGTVVAAVSVARAGLLHGFARWALVVVALCTPVTVILWSVPLLAIAEAGPWIVILRPLSLLALAIACLAHGRAATATATVRNQLHVINEKW